MAIRPSIGTFKKWKRDALERAFDCERLTGMVTSSELKLTCQRLATACTHILNTNLRAFETINAKKVESRPSEDFLFKTKK